MKVRSVPETWLVGMSQFGTRRDVSTLRRDAVARAPAVISSMKSSIQKFLANFDGIPVVPMSRETAFCALRLDRIPAGFRASLLQI